MPNPPQNGRRLPPKPTRADIEVLARESHDSASRAERRVRTLARLMVAVLAAPWYLRAWYCVRILMRHSLHVSREALEQASATQLYVHTAIDGFTLGADDQKDEAPS